MKLQVYYISKGDKLKNMNDTKYTCRYCNTKDVKTYKKLDIYTLSYCNKCKVISTNTIPQRESRLVNSEWYSKDYISNYIFRAMSIKKRFKERILEIETIKQGGKILDLGSGIGLFLESMRESAKFDWELYGVEINNNLYSAAKKRLKPFAPKLYLGRLTSLKLPNNYFDCITCFDVLEHDSNLQNTLREIKKILKPSGLLLIQSPNEFSVMAHLCGALWDWWAVPDHIFHFNVNSFASILKKQGFQIRETYTWDPRIEFILNIQGSIKNRIGPKSFLGKFIARYSYIPLLLLWFVLSIIEKKLNIGGLLIIKAES